MMSITIQIEIALNKLIIIIMMVEIYTMLNYSRVKADVNDKKDGSSKLSIHLNMVI